MDRDDLGHAVSGDEGGEAADGRRRAIAGEGAVQSNRHRCAALLVMAGVDRRTVQELGGWKTASMVSRYVHLAPAHLSASVERLVAPDATGERLARNYSDGGGTHDQAAPTTVDVAREVCVTTMVPGGGIEPPRPEGHQILSLARLPSSAIPALLIATGA